MSRAGAQLCPSCNKEFDPLLARDVRIARGKIVAFCSAECARSSETPGEQAVGRMSTVPMSPEIAAQLARPPEPAPAPVLVRSTLRPGGPTPDGAEIRADEEAAANLVISARRRATYPGAGKLKTRGVWAAAAAALVAGVITAVVLLVNTDNPAPASAQPTATMSATPGTENLALAAEPAAVVPATGDALAVEARTTLEKYLEHASPRVRVLAAIALVRTGHETARGVLHDSLDKDPSEIRRLEVAGALARTGDERGISYLVDALGSSRRDVRLEAARSLAQIGDARGQVQLEAALRVRTLQLGAAEALALIGVKEGFEMLHDALADRDKETRMRAAVALGRAGDPAGKELLRQIVDEPQVELGAASALARLGDKKAVPALERALRLTALRVEAAVALRRMDAPVDTQVLVGALSSGDDLARISAAESILVLTLPKSALPWLAGNP